MNPTQSSASGPSGRRAAAGLRWTERDAFLFDEGTHGRLWERLGAHPQTIDGRPGTAFAVWAPAARRVSVIGSFNGWNPGATPLARVGRGGIWGGFVPGVGEGAAYKFHINSRLGGYSVDKADPFAVRAETPPRTASIVHDLSYEWGDRDWLARRTRRDADSRPMSVYELHLGSWRRPGHGSLPRYRELAGELIPYLRRTGFTHVELMPPMEHPFYGSWGYQVTGQFAATSRYGTPQDLMFLIDQLHQADIGVIVDWVPSHFPTDEHGPGFFDGTHLFEHADPRQGFHPDWSSFIFNYDHKPVCSYLLSSALFWLERFHVDVLRVDAVSSMLYLDYSRDEGQWVPNRFGGRENLGAIRFLRTLNRAVHENYPGVLTVAEEATSWPGVTRSAELGGLGFDMKWDMGWMHDTLEYFGKDPLFRKFDHQKLTFRMMYAWSERFVLSLSHDEVVHGKRSLLDKMPGDVWNKFANLRSLYGYMFGLPGKKLLFMGGEFGQWREWSHERELDWGLLSEPLHAGLQRWVTDLNRLHTTERALHRLDFDSRGFEWVDCADVDQSVVSFIRHATADRRGELVLVVCNLTPLPREHYRIGVPRTGRWVELLNSDAESYGGSGVGNMGTVEAQAIEYHAHPYSLDLTLPPLSVSFFRAPRRAGYRIRAADESAAPASGNHESL